MTKYKILGLVVLALAVIAILGVGTLWLINFLHTQDQVNSQQVLSQILQNNPQLAAGTFGNKSGLATDAASSLSIRAPGVYNPLGGDYNYSHTTSTYKPGSALNTCPALSYGGDQLRTTETFQYFGGETESYTYYSKYLVTDADGDLVDYTLNSNNSQISYRGGNYAVKNSQIYYLDNAASSGEATPVSYGTDDIAISNTPNSTDISTYFGPDAKVEGPTTIDGKSYYVVTWSYDAPCTQDLNANNYSSTISSKILPPIDNSTNIKVYQRELVDPSTFEIKETQTYKSGISAANLISTTTTTIDNQKVQFADVASEFNFDYGVDIKTIDYDKFNTTDYLVGNIQKYITINMSKFLITDTSDYSMTYAYTPQAAPNYDVQYYLDRNFYAAGAKGDALYAETQKIYATDPNTLVQNLNISYTNNSSQYLELAAYNGAVTPNELINSYGYGDSSALKTDSTISIDGNSVNVTAYTISFGGTSVPGSGPDGKISPTNPSDIASQVSALIVFDYQGNKYLITTSGITSVFDFTSHLKLKSIDVNNSDQLNDFLNQVTAALNGNSGSGVKAL